MILAAGRNSGRWGLRRSGTENLYMGCVVGNQAWIERGAQELEVSIEGTDRGRGSLRDDDRPGTMGGCTRPFLKPSAMTRTV